MRQIVPILVSVLGLLLTACSEDFSDGQLLGTYAAEFGGEIATLTLNADHSYSHAIRRKDGQSMEVKAQWKRFTVESGGTRWTIVSFPRFSPLPAYEAANPPRHDTAPQWHPEVHRSWLWRIRLCFDDDVGYCYVKQQQ